MKTSCALMFALAVLAPSTAFAGGWTQDDGAMYGKIWSRALFGSAAFDLDGNQLDTEKFSLVSLSAYGEYGLHRDLTLVGSMEPIGVAHYGDQTRAYAGRMLVGLRQRLVSDTLQLALEARLGGSPGWGGERDMAPTDADIEFRPTIRSYYAEWDLQLGVPIGGVGWVTAAVGPRWATSPDLSSALHSTLQIGFGPFSGFLFDLHVTHHHTFDPPTTVNAAGATDTRYVGAGVGMSWWIVDAFGINASADIAPYAASNTVAPALQLGVEFRR